MPGGELTRLYVDNTTLDQEITPLAPGLILVSVDTAGTLNVRLCLHSIISHRPFFYLVVLSNFTLTFRTKHTCFILLCMTLSNYYQKNNMSVRFTLNRAQLTEPIDLKLCVQINDTHGLKLDLLFTIWYLTRFN